MNTKNNIFLTCNFTRISIAEEDFASRIKEIANKYSFDRNKLVIEITEDSLTANNKQSQKNIAMCKEMGFKIAIDDMGSGFSAISDLYDNDVDVVKIEQSIIHKATTEKRYKLLKALIYLAHDMNARVICEGVETEEHRNIVLKTDCDMMQGFYYSRVLPYREAMNFLKYETKEW